MVVLQLEGLPLVILLMDLHHTLCLAPRLLNLPEHLLFLLLQLLDPSLYHLRLLLGPNGKVLLLHDSALHAVDALGLEGRYIWWLDLVG